MASELKKKTVSGVIWSSLERFSVQGVGFLFSIFMARLLAPSDYGVIAMLTIFMAVAQAFIDSGFSNALIRKVDRTEKDYATVFYFNIAISVACYGLLFMVSPYIALFYNTPILDPLTKVVALSLVVGSFAGVQRAHLSIKLDFKTQAKISLTSVFISGVIGIICAYKGLGVWALAIQSLSNGFISTIFLWAFVKWIPKERFSKESFKAMFSYGSKLLASGLLDVIYNNIYTIVIGKFFSGALLGNYARADNLAQFPSSNITGVLQRVTFPVLSTIQNEDVRLRIIYRKILRLSAFVVFPMMIGLAAVAKPFILVLLTAKWSETILLLQIICFALMWYPVHAINLNLLQVKGRSDLFLRLEIIKKIMGVAILSISIPLGVVAMCAGRVCTSILALIINTYYTGKLIQVGFFVQMMDLCPIFLNCLMMGAAAYGASQLFNTPFFSLLAGGVAGSIYYLGSNYILSTQELKDLILILKRK